MKLHLTLFFNKFGNLTWHNIQQSVWNNLTKHKETKLIASHWHLQRVKFGVNSPSVINKRHANEVWEWDGICVSFKLSLPLTQPICQNTNWKLNERKTNVSCREMPNVEQWKTESIKSMKQMIKSWSATSRRFARTLALCPWMVLPEHKNVNNVLAGHSIPYKNLTVPVWKDNFWKIPGHSS